MASVPCARGEGERDDGWRRPARAGESRCLMRTGSMAGRRPRRNCIRIMELGQRLRRDRARPHRFPSGRWRRCARCFVPSGATDDSAYRVQPGDFRRRVLPGPERWACDEVAPDAPPAYARAASAATVHALAIQRAVAAAARSAGGIMPGRRSSALRVAPLPALGARSGRVRTGDDRPPVGERMDNSPRCSTRCRRSRSIRTGSRPTSAPTSSMSPMPSQRPTKADYTATCGSSTA